MFKESYQNLPGILRHIFQAQEQALKPQKIAWSKVTKLIVSVQLRWLAPFYRYGQSS